MDVNSKEKVKRVDIFFDKILLFIKLQLGRHECINFTELTQKYIQCTSVCQFVEDYNLNRTLNRAESTNGVLDSGIAPIMTPDFQIEGKNFFLLHFGFSAQRSVQE